MAIETFTWRTQTQNQPQGTYTHRVREAEFGDGYKQVSGDGLNPETQSWPLTFTGRELDMLPILSFMRKHTIKAFIWSPPYGAPGLYRVAKDSVSAMPVGGNAMTVMATFEQAYAP
ncbi:phage tail protein [Pectobacterium betavasculorum]|uniref:phage tail protein n=1 Tax=Pectobacterium betavasculorum TaxID=55207 RepID=UPI00313B2139